MKRWSTLALALALAVLCSQDAFTFSFKSQLSKLANSNKRGTFSGGLSPKVHRRLVSSDRASLHTLFLDLDDVLEDDLDYLTQLRRQMQSSFSASPRELTNRIKDYFNNNKRTSDDHRAFQSYLEQNGQTMDSVNAIMLIEGCSKNGVAIESLISWEALLAAMDRPSAMMTSSMIYRGISVMKALDYKDSRVKKFFHALADRIDESNVVLNQCDICPSIYSLQSLNAYSFDTKRIIVYLTKCMAQTSIPFPTKAICSAIYGLKKMKPLPEVRGLVEQIATKIRDSETYFHSVNICIALNGLQHMDDNCPQVRKLMAALMDKAIPAEEQGMDRAGDREISMALFGKHQSVF